MPKEPREILLSQRMLLQLAEASEEEPLGALLLATAGSFGSCTWEPGTFEPALASYLEDLAELAREAYAMSQAEDSNIDPTDEKATEQ